MAEHHPLTPHPEPFFGWLDYNAEQAGKMREVLAAFDEKDTIDSLGLGVIRDSIAEALFPGVSTIQTRARYYLIVPWICQYLESRRVGKGNVERDLRWYEARTITLLQQNCTENDRVIGWEAGSRLQRMPSSVYWNGIGVLGIRRDRALSLRQYLSTIGSSSPDLLHRRSNDDGESTDAARGFWDPGLPSAPPKYPDPGEGIDLTLTESESEYLRDKFATHALDDQPENTLLAHLANNLQVDRGVELPWELLLEAPTDALRARIEHARRFSEATQGARILYNNLLAKKCRERGLLANRVDEMDARVGGDFESWSRVVSSQSRQLAAWSENLSDFWEFVGHFGRPSESSKTFVKEWTQLVLADPSSILEDQDAHELVITRERRLKRKLARLSNDRVLESFNGTVFDPNPLNYRWTNARNHLEDIVNHAGAADAAS